MHKAIGTMEEHFNPDDLNELDSLFFDSEGPVDPSPEESSVPIVALIFPKGGNGNTSVPTCQGLSADIRSLRS